MATHIAMLISWPWRDNAWKHTKNSGTVLTPDIHTHLIWNGMNPKDNLNSYSSRLYITNTSITCTRTQLTKTSRSKRPALNSIINNSSVLLKNWYQWNINTIMYASTESSHVYLSWTQMRMFSTTCYSHGSMHIGYYASMYINIPLQQDNTNCKTKHPPYN